MSTIFQEPSPNVDEMWTHGAMLGGMCGYDDQGLADSYFLAGDALIAAVLRGEMAGQEIIGPVMFVYRHGIELYLKCIVQPSERNHNLASLLEFFCRQVRERYHETVPTWITEPIAEFARFDPDAQVFRYEKNTKGEYHLGGSELWIDLPSVQRSMSKLRRVFRRVMIANATGKIPPVGVG